MRAAGIHQGLAPVLDVARDPRWGRVEETIGADPYLVGVLGSAYVLGLQSAGVHATLKHFVGYSGSRAGRNQAPVSVGPRELGDVFLPPFEMAIRNGRARSVMHSYAELDGVPPAADHALLTGCCAAILDSTASSCRLLRHLLPGSAAPGGGRRRKRPRWRCVPGWTWSCPMFAASASRCWKRPCDPEPCPRAWLTGRPGGCCGGNSNSVCWTRRRGGRAGAGGNDPDFDPPVIPGLRQEAAERRSCWSPTPARYCRCRRRTRVAVVGPAGRRPAGVLRLLQHSRGTLDTRIPEAAAACRSPPAGRAAAATCGGRPGARLQRRG